MAESDKTPVERIGGILRLLGIGKLILAAMVLVMAFTGYDTPRPVNGVLLLVGINLVLLGLLSLATGRAFRFSSVDEALRKVGSLFGYYFVLLALAILGVGYDLFVVFLPKILSS